MGKQKSIGREGLRRAIRIAGSQSALGRLIGVSQQLVWSWLHVTYKIPAYYAFRITELGKSYPTIRELRPDLFES